MLGQLLARRAGWTFAYIACVFLLVGAFGYAEWRAETASWRRDLRAPRAAVRATVLGRYSLRPELWPRPAPCAALVRALIDVPEVRREAVPALSRVVRSGECVRAVRELLKQAYGDSVKIAAVRILRFAPQHDRPLVLPELIEFASTCGQLGDEALVSLQQMGVNSQQSVGQYDSSNARMLLRSCSSSLSRAAR